MTLERTDLGQQQFDSELSRFRDMQRTIESEPYYPTDPIAQEDYMYRGVYDLAEAGSISDEQASYLFMSWIANRRPDTAVLRVAPQPRGYGRGYLNE